MSADTNYTLAPWHPITDKVDLKHLGKLGEEAGELVSAVCRCTIQGIDEVHPETRKPNREWLEDEIADVLAGCYLTIENFNLDQDRMDKRILHKMDRLRSWHEKA